ncbi:MAG: deoxyribose-phosphate aldolase [Phycisphaerae bacterium]|nr:deoxyribose-phosphate aldolase [Phycisphaerae bacterium]
MTNTYLTPESLAGMIDHAVLAPTATLDDLRDGCQLAAKYNVASICVRPCDVATAAELLKAKNSPVAVGTVISFPHGSCATQIKAAETAQAISDGADEIDMVMNFARFIGAENSTDAADFLRDEVTAVVSAAQGKCVKVIMECCYLNHEQIAAACKVIMAAGAEFVKTSTGFGSGGATVEDVTLMREVVGAEFGVKASGGIRTLSDAAAMIAAGVTRLGTSNTAGILTAMHSTS